MPTLLLLFLLCALWVLSVKSFSFAARVAGLSLAALVVANSASNPQEPHHSYLGFDRNDYPGDDAMKRLRKDFAFTSYWLSAPPGEKENTWSGKRELLRSQGFGFLALFRGPQSSELQSVWSESRRNRSDSLNARAEEKGKADARRAADAAKKEGFSPHTVVFLDIEEGGRLPEVYHTYLRAWTDELAQSGYRAGVYCSGMPVSEGPGATIITADDIRDNMGTRKIIYWVFNDACPPSPGCAFPQSPPAPSKSGIAYVQVWQFVRSPRDKQTARHCRGYASDGNCYAASDSAHKWFLDVNSGTSSDPGGGTK